IREERELCCDDIALAICSDPATYATALLRLEEQRRNYLQLAVALNGSGSRLGLATRVRRILGEQVLRQPRSFAAHSLIVLGATTGISLLSAPQLSAKLLPPLKSQIQAESLPLRLIPQIASPIVTPRTQVAPSEARASVTPQPAPNP